MFFDSECKMFEDILINKYVFMYCQLWNTVTGINNTGKVVFYWLINIALTKHYFFCHETISECKDIPLYVCTTYCTELYMLLMPCLLVIPCWLGLWLWRHHFCSGQGFIHERPYRLPIGGINTSMLIIFFVEK